MKFYGIDLLKISKSYQMIYNKEIKIHEFYNRDNKYFYTKTHVLKKKWEIIHSFSPPDRCSLINNCVLTNFSGVNILYFENFEDAYITKLLNIQYFRNKIEQELLEILQKTLNKLPDVKDELSKYPEYLI
jgi:hypothetical protein